LAGSAGSFGLHELSQMAIPLDASLRTIQQRGIAPDDEELPEIDVQMQDFLKTAKTSYAKDETPNKPMLSDKEVEIEANGRLLYLVDDDKNYALDLALHLKKAGYSVKVFHDAEHLADVIKNNRLRHSSWILCFKKMIWQGLKSLSKSKKTAPRLCLWCLFLHGAI